MTHGSFRRHGLINFDETEESTPTTWNHRIILHDLEPDTKRHYYALHEVYYSDGKMSWTEDPISFVCAAELGEGDLIRNLEHALKSAKKEPVLLESELEKQTKDK